LSVKKFSTKASVFVVIFLFVIGLSILAVMINKNEHPKHTSIPFTYQRADDVDPEMLTKDIMQAIGYPNAVPYLTNEDRFFVVLYNQPKQQDTDKGLNRIASTFRIRLPNEQVLSYEFRATQSEELMIVYRNEVKSERRPNEQFHPSSDTALADILGAIRDFPAESYREHTEYGNESADLYQIHFNDGLLSAEKFSYNMDGPVENNDHGNGIPFVISHMRWGKIRDESLDYNDHDRYYSFGGEGRANLFYYPRS